MRRVLFIMGMLFFVIHAQDESAPVGSNEGATIQPTKEITATTPKSQTDAKTINVAILDLQNRGNFSEDEIKLITDRINSEVYKTGKFTLVERQQIGDILEEQGFQQSGACTDQNCMVEVGRLLSVNKVIGGSIGKLESIFPVTLKVIDVETGKVDAQIIKDFKGSKTKLLSEYIPQITHDLMVKAGYVKPKDEAKKKSLLTKAGFWIPTVVIVSGGAAAAILLTKKDTDPEIGNDLDISDFPDHDIVIPVK